MSNKLTKTARDQKIIEALGTQLKAASAITLDGAPYKAKDLQQEFQAEVDAAKATETAKNAYTQAVLAEQKVGSQVTLLRKSLRAYLIATYGAKSAIVAEFGFTPKQTPVDVATKAAANAKRAETRAKGGAKASHPKPGTTGTTPSVPAVAPEATTPPAPAAAAVNGVAPKTAAAN